MDSFDEDTQVLHMKRKFESAMAKADTGLRHNLLDDFERASNEPIIRFKAARFEDIQPANGFTPSPSLSQNDSSTLSRQMKLKQAEIASLKASVTKMENRVAAAHREGQQAHIEHEKLLTDCKIEKEKEVKKAAELKSKLQYVMEREKISREETHRLEKELHQRSKEMSEKLLKEQKERMEACSKYQHSKMQWMQKEEDLMDKIMSQNRQISDLQNKHEESLAKFALQKDTSINETDITVKNLEDALQKEKNKVKDLETKFALHEDNIVATKALKADLDLVPSLKTELEKLRQDNEKLRLNEQNALLLEEEIRSLKGKLKLVEPFQEKYINLEVENEELKERLTRWEASDSSGTRRPQSPSSLAKKVSDLEVTNASILVNKGELQTKVHLLERKLNQSLSETNRLSAALTSEKNTTTQLNDLVKRMKRKMVLQSKERDAYKNLLNSYESEVTVNFDEEKKVQIERLEAILLEYQETTAESEAKVESLSNQLADTLTSYHHQQVQNLSQPLQQSSEEDKETLRQLREQLVAAEEELLKTQGEKNVLEAKIEQRQLQGDYDPSKTKIIHMLENPHSLAQKARQEQLTKLEEENDRLKKRNEILEENGGMAEGITMQVEEKLQSESPSKEVENLRSQLVSADMRVQRLKEVFAKTSKEFREVVYQLTGYRFDIPCANQYRLTSMYAAHKKDHLLFQQNDQGEIQLLHTDFSMNFQDAMEKYLQSMGSLPLFLSHITMELFNGQTIALG